MKPRYAVMVRCLSGTIRNVGGAWEKEQHTITWAVEDSQEDAWDVARELLTGNYLVCIKAWVEER